MRRLAALCWILSSGCSPTLSWTPWAVAEEPTFILARDANDQLRLLGSSHDTAVPLEIEVEATDQVWAIVLRRKELELVFPILDPARPAGLEVQLGAESCPYREVDVTFRSVPMPSETEVFELTPSLEWSSPVVEAAGLLAALKLHVPVDHARCATLSEPLRPFAAGPSALANGFTSAGEAHFVDAPDAENVFGLRRVLRVDRDHVVLRSFRFLYWLRRGHTIDGTDPGELIAAASISGLPAEQPWLFLDMARSRTEPNRFLVALKGPSEAEEEGALLEVIVTTTGFGPPRVVARMKHGLRAVAVSEDDSYLALGGEASAFYGRISREAPTVEVALPGGSFKDVVAAPNAPGIFWAGSSTGQLVRIDGPRASVEVLNQDTALVAIQALARSRTTPGRGFALDFNGGLTKLDETGIGPQWAVPGPSTTPDCVSLDDENACLRWLLGARPHDVETLPDDTLVFGANRCIALLAWRPDAECAFSIQAEPPVPNGLGFEGFEAIDVYDGFLTAAGRGGLVYELELP